MKDRHDCIKWRHVFEELPDADIEVLVALPDESTVWIGYHDDGCWFVNDIARPVAYWAELPSHPSQTPTLSEDNRQRVLNFIARENEDPIDGSARMLGYALMSIFVIWVVIITTALLLATGWSS